VILARLRTANEPRGSKRPRVEGLLFFCAKSKLDCQTVLPCAMPPVLFRCPNTGYHVQGWFAEDVSDNGEDTYQSLTCLACRQVHLVNPKTGNVVGATGE
jgi:hypothetical protein